jgi:hypothetical protein
VKVGSSGGVCVFVGVKVGCGGDVGVSQGPAFWMSRKSSCGLPSANTRILTSQSVGGKGLYEKVYVVGPPGPRVQV